MKPRTVTLIVLLVLSEAVGIAVGEVFFRLFLKAVPPVALSKFNTQAAQIAHLAYGVGVGLVLFVWALIGMAVGRVSGSRSKSTAS
jgi:hypothetical protein